MLKKLCSAYNGRHMDHYLVEIKQHEARIKVTSILDEVKMEPFLCFLIYF